MTVFLCAYALVSTLWLLMQGQTLRHHERHLKALDDSMHANKRHLAAHDGTIGLLRR